ncbi:MAG: stage III sporulation protein AB, partial [Firmicutes bacterium]|nr:stage III sporulation protein AB [Bacillota bacterium]
MGGLAVARCYRLRHEELRTWVTALAALRTEVSFGRTRLPAAMRRAGRAAGGACETVLTRAADGLERGGDGRTPRECLSDALRTMAKGGGQATHLWDEDIDILLALGEALGSSGPDDQVRHIMLASWCAIRSEAS